MILLTNVKIYSKIGTDITEEKEKTTLNTKYVGNNNNCWPGSLLTCNQKCRRYKTRFLNVQETWQFGTTIITGKPLWLTTVSVVVYADINFLMSLTVTELKARSCQTTGYTTAGPPSRSTPGTLPRELLYNTVTLWRSNIRSEATLPGCTTILAAFTLGAAATTTKQHAQLKTLLLASGSLRSCEAIMLWLNCKTNLQQFDDWKRL